MQITSHPSASEIVHVAFTLSPARHGWIGLAVTAGAQSDEIACSDVYDPFEELARWATGLVHGFPATVEIDEEGRTTQLWLTREPGSHLGRLRVFEPGPTGAPERLHVDVAVDVIQVAFAYHGTFSAYVESYDPRHWDRAREDGAPPRRFLAEVDLGSLRHTLGSYGLIPGPEVSPDLRAAYDAELGDRALAVAA